MINYVIGRYWKNSDSIGCYMEMNQQIFYGEEKDAYKHAQRISKQEGKKYKVFKLVDISSYYDSN